MGVAQRKSKERPRELRRRVVVPARLRIDASWSDTCILNISSRGLLVRAARPPLPGSLVELRRGDHTIVATVMWSEGGRAGLRSDDCLPVDEILSLGQAQALQLIASEGALIERRKRPRHDHAAARSHGRALEFAAIVAIGAILAGCAWGMAHTALATPFAAVEARLAG